VNTVDPFGGSYAIEALTDDIERDAEALLARIDGMGGPLPAIEAGFIQREIQEAAYRAQQSIDSGAAVVVGVNRFADPTASSSIDVFQVNAEVERGQIERVRRQRRTREPGPFQETVAAVAAAARSGTNLVPPVIAAVEAGATIGEVSDAMRSVFGEFEETYEV
jgi:methylmalonyl-CoA mutase N-terminal domain/subunit